MKRRNLIVIATILLLTVLSVCVFASCNSTSKIDKLYKKLQKADSMVITVTVSSNSESVTFKTYYDGNKTYTPASYDSAAVFTEEVDGMLNVYIEDAYGWRKQSYPANEESTEFDDTQLAQLFNSENYEYSSEKKAFVKKEGVNIEYEDMNFYSLYLAIDGSSCKFSGTFFSDYVLFECVIEIDDVNDVELSREEIVGR